jgi:hypothetical protein
MAGVSENMSANATSDAAPLNGYNIGSGAAGPYDVDYMASLLHGLCDYPSGLGIINIQMHAHA